MSEKIISLDGLAAFKAKADEAYATPSDLAAKQDALVSGTNIKTINSQSLLGSGNIDISTTPMVETTWAALKELRDNSSLVPGMQYRITDYTCTTTTALTHSAGHVFDVIVVADNESTLNKKARAVLHEGDTYFANSDLAAWQLWYDLDNDQTKYAWADTVNGKGIIFRMIDEFNNDVPYDFKNIQFKRYDITEFELVEGQFFNERSQRKKDWFNSVKSVMPFRFCHCYSTPVTGQTAVDEDYPYLLDKTEEEVLNSGLTYCIIDDPAWEGNPGLLAQFNADSINYDWFYTFTNRINNTNTDKSLTNICHHNEFIYTLIDGIYQLYDNVFITSTLINTCYCNTFGDTCYYNTFGNNCRSNALGNTCYSNTFGNNCHSNTFENDCYCNVFGNDYIANVFGRNCYYNTFGNNCYSNILGKNCFYNTVGSNSNDNILENDCGYNTFGYQFIDNKLGNGCSANTLGNRCQLNAFGNGCYANILCDYCRSNTFGVNCTDISLQSSASGDVVQYVYIHSGVKGTSSTPLVIDVPVKDQDYSIDYYAPSSQEIILGGNN